MNIDILKNNFSASSANDADFKDTWILSASLFIPQINQLISLFKNPTQFIVDIIGEKAGENILFLNKESLQTYSDGFKKLIDLKKIEC